MLICPLRRGKPVRGLLAGGVAFVAIAKRICEGLAVCAEAHVVHCPAIHGQGSDAFRCGSRRLAQSFFEARENFVERPAQRTMVVHRSVGDAVNQRDLRPALTPAKQRYTATLSTKV